MSIIHLTPPPSATSSPGRMTTVTGRLIAVDTRAAAFEAARWAATYLELMTRAHAAQGRITDGTPARVRAALHGLEAHATRTSGMWLQIAGEYYQHFGMTTAARPNMGGAEATLNGVRWADGVSERWTHPAHWVSAGERMVSAADRVLGVRATSIERGGFGASPGGMGIAVLAGLPWAVQAVAVGVGLAAAALVVYASIRYAIDALSAWSGRDVRTTRASLSLYERMLDDAADLPPAERAAVYERVLEGIDALNTPTSPWAMVGLGAVAIAAVLAWRGRA